MSAVGRGAGVLSTNGPKGGVPVISQEAEAAFAEAEAMREQEMFEEAAAAYEECLALVRVPRRRSQVNMFVPGCPEPRRCLSMWLFWLHITRLSTALSWCFRLCALFFP